jgi:dTDP-4-amino-4,6-dideoxygalactose transaminase
MPAPARIPFVNLQAQLDRLKPELLAQFGRLIDSREFIQGRYAQEFEAQFASAHGVPHVVGCANGTAALTLALRALGIGPGDEVITVAHTFIATAEAICEAGATPVFVDVLADTHVLDPARLEAAVTNRTRAVIPVHLYGNPCDMDAIMAVARARGLKVIEDCAQAHLATYRGKPVGGFGEAGTFSFYPGKNLGALGDAGCIVTRDEALATRMRKLRDHGRLSKYEHDLVGFNERMDGLQAAALLVKLPHLKQWTETRRRNAGLYVERLSEAGVKTTRPTPGADPVWHLFVVELDDRQAAASRLEQRGIGTGVHYPVPLHLQPAFRYLGYRPGQLPVTEAAARRVLSLPMCGELAAEQVDEVCRELVAAVR